MHSEIFSPRAERVLLVDGHAYAYRAFHAIRELRGPDGRPTNAIFGFLKMLGKMRNWVEPTHLAVVWDGGLAEERIRLQPGYKAQRPPTPPDLEDQLPQIQDYLDAAAIVSLQRDGVEADDWIATLARASERRGWDVVIASSDKDFMQLVSDRIALLNPNDKTERLWSAEDVRAKAGVDPGQIVDWLSLIGDSVDNIPGVAGVGPKTATGLLGKHGSIEGIYANLADVTPERVRNLLMETRALLRDNVEMIRLRTEISSEVSVDQLSIRCGDMARQKKLLRGWGFRSMVTELEARETTQAELF